MLKVFISSKTTVTKDLNWLKICATIKTNFEQKTKSYYFATET